MQTGTLRIKIRVTRSKPRTNVSSVQLWTNAARGLACVWEDDKYV